MSEHKLSANLVKLLRNKGFTVQRIESRLFKGIPDINYCRPDGIEGWIELKYKTFSLSNEQFIWLRERSKYNKNTYVVLLDKDYCLIDCTEFIKFTNSPQLKDLNCVHFDNIQDLVLSF